MQNKTNSDTVKFLLILLLLMPIVVPFILSQNALLFYTNQLIDQDKFPVNISITNIDSFQLQINEPEINYNFTHLTVSNLTITFTNGTEIFYADEADIVTLITNNSIGVAEEYSMSYSNETHWKITIDLGNYAPRKYTIILVVSTGEFYFNKTIYEFEKNYEILFDEIYLLVFNEEKIMVLQCSITTLAHEYREYILLDYGNVSVSFFNSSNYCIMSSTLYQSGFIGNWYTWSSGYLNISDFKDGFYYGIVYVDYDEELYISQPSNTAFIGEEESTTPTPSTPEPTENTISTLLSVISVLFISCLYFWKRKKVRSRKK